MNIDDSKDWQVRSVARLKQSIKNGKLSVELLRRAGKAEAALQLERYVEQMVAFLESGLPFHLDVTVKQTKKGPTRHPLELFFLEQWKLVFPNYTPSGFDIISVRKMFQHLREAMPNCNEVVIKRALQNFKSSSADWLAGKNMNLFAKHFPARFLSGPENGFNKVLRLDRDGTSGDGPRTSRTAALNFAVPMIQE